MGTMACHLCAAHRAVVFCSAHAARLCLQCDAAMHDATALTGLHSRAPLCDACGAAPAALRCATDRDRLALCAECADRCAPAGTYARCPISQYTGCPGPAEIVRHVSLEAPSPQEDFDAWLADKLPHLFDDDEDTVPELPAAASAAAGGHYMEDAGMQVYYDGNAMGTAAGGAGGEGGGFGGCDAVATIEKFLADDWSGPCAAAREDAGAGLLSNQTTTSSACHLLPSSSSCHGQPEAAVMASALVQSLTNDHFLLGGSSTSNAMASSFGYFPLISMPIPPPESTITDFQQDSQTPSHGMVAADKKPSQQQDPSTMDKKREERDRAKLRYNEKKRNRKFCKQIMYESRKASGHAKADQGPIRKGYH